jgi:hypothetical protein
MDYRRIQEGPTQRINVAVAFVYRCQALVEGEAVAGALMVMESVDGSLAIEAIETCWLLLGSAVLHDHPLVQDSHSVHTSRESLARGVAGIEAVGQCASCIGCLPVPKPLNRAFGCGGVNRKPPAVTGGRSCAAFVVGPCRAADLRLVASSGGQPEAEPGGAAALAPRPIGCIHRLAD